MARRRDLGLTLALQVHLESQWRTIISYFTCEVWATLGHSGLLFWLLGFPGSSTTKNGGPAQCIVSSRGQRHQMCRYHKGFKYLVHRILHGQSAAFSVCAALSWFWATLRRSALLVWPHGLLDKHAPCGVCSRIFQRCNTKYLESYEVPCINCFCL